MADASLQRRVERLEENLPDWDALRKIRGAKLHEEGPAGVRTGGKEEETSSGAADSGGNWLVALGRSRATWTSRSFVAAMELCICFST